MADFYELRAEAGLLLATPQIRCAKLPVDLRIKALLEAVAALPGPRGWRAVVDAAEDAEQAEWAAAQQYEVRDRAGGRLYLAGGAHRAVALLRTMPEAFDVLDRHTNEVIASRADEEVDDPTI